jgi:hypothetical protein
MESLLFLDLLEVFVCFVSDRQEWEEVWGGQKYADAIQSHGWVGSRNVPRTTLEAQSMYTNGKAQLIHKYPSLL